VPALFLAEVKKAEVDLTACGAGEQWR
jgi:hypothetical protein